MYLCIFCQLEVAWEDSADICDECDQWQHRRCHTGMSFITQALKVGNHVRPFHSY